MNILFKTAETQHFFCNNIIIHRITKMLVTVTEFLTRGESMEILDGKL